MSINNARVMLGAESRALCRQEYPNPELCTQHFFVLVFDFLKRSCLFSFGQGYLGSIPYIYAQFSCAESLMVSGHFAWNLVLPPLSLNPQSTVIGS